MSGVELLLSDARGIYIPRDFASECNGWDNIPDKDREILEAGPEHELYWDTWNDVLAEASFTDDFGNIWHLWQDGDLFIFCAELMTDEEHENLFGEPRMKEEQEQEDDVRALLVKLDQKLDQVLARLNNQNMF